MTVRNALSSAKKIIVPSNPLPVEKNCAVELIKNAAISASVVKGGADSAGFRIAVASNAHFPTENILQQAKKFGEIPWAYFKISQDGEGELVVSHANLLFAYTHKIIEESASKQVEEFATGKFYQAAFRWHRPIYDYLLTQVWRTARNFDAESHIRDMAKAGYTHVEVNGLAQPIPLEEAIPGEFYSQFYSYCIALDQYVYSELNKGIYPFEYLTANLNLLKKFATIGKKYGLSPGILCFEPRTVPEKLLKRYPTLRGARVDHPLRSRLPRYTLTHAHPRVQAHYAEMMTKLMQAVPELAFMSIWSNDSGAGFEYTSSLYVGRNGGPYLIREWRTHEQIAEVAGKNVVHYMQILKDAATKINPDFRVSLRLEPFKVEHDVIMKHLQPQIDIEVPSMLVRGYDLPYHHEKYDDVPGVAGSILHNHIEPQEKEMIEKLEGRGIGSHMVYSQGNGFNLEPLIGIPFPWLLHEKLQAMRDTGVRYAANLGGFTPERLAPYQINREMYRAFMLEPEVNPDHAVMAKAKDWVGEQHAEALVNIWREAEQAVRWMPPLPLYSGFGFVWLRVWVRPFIPDLLAVPQEERRYYEDFMVSPANNTNNTDLGKDVLFELISKEYGESYAARVDQNALPHLDKAIEAARALCNDKTLSGDQRTVIVDQLDRLRGFRCWLKTQRSVAAWAAGVYNYLEAKNEADRKRWRAYIDEMMDLELQNAKDLLELWQTSSIDSITVSEVGETSYIYGENLGELIKQKIDLMQKYRHVEPRIDRTVLWKI